MAAIDLPLGTQFKSVVDGKFVTVVVAEAKGCAQCIYSDGSFICKDIACSAEERSDSTNIIIKKMEGGEND